MCDSAIENAVMDHDKRMFVVFLSSAYPVWEIPIITNQMELTNESDPPTHGMTITHQIGGNRNRS